MDLRRISFVGYIFALIAESKFDYFCHLSLDLTNVGDSHRRKKEDDIVGIFCIYRWFHLLFFCSLLLLLQLSSF